MSLSRKDFYPGVLSSLLLGTRHSFRVCLSKQLFDSGFTRFFFFINRFVPNAGTFSHRLIPSAPSASAFLPQIRVVPDHRARQIYTVKIYPNRTVVIPSVIPDTDGVFPRCETRVEFRQQIVQRRI